MHSLRLTSLDDLDGELPAWRIGQQEHVTDPRWRKVRRPPAWVRVPREVREAIEAGFDPSRVRRGPGADRTRRGRRREPDA